MDKTDMMFRLIVEYKRRFDGISPSIRELTIGCGLSSTSMGEFYLKKLEEQQKIKRMPGVSRGIMVVGGEWRHILSPNGGRSESVQESNDQGTAG